MHSQTWTAWSDNSTIRVSRSATARALRRCSAPRVDNDPGFRLNREPRSNNQRPATESHWNGLTTLTPSTSWLSCMSSEKSTGQPACPAARTTIASQKEIWCSRCKSIAARISDTSGATTLNSANHSPYAKGNFDHLADLAANRRFVGVPMGLGCCDEW
jgi:hypothetical protein